MSRRRMNEGTEITGVVGYSEWEGDNDLSVCITTDYGDEYILTPCEALGDPFYWIDRYVLARGRTGRYGGRRCLFLDFLEEIDATEHLYVEGEDAWAADDLAEWED